MPEETEPANTAAETNRIGLRVLGQYIRDLSFENPASGPMRGQPNINLSIDVSATPHESNPSTTFEVGIKLNAQATSEDTPLFICELDYAGLFEVQGGAGQDIEPILLIECPRLMFPFARRIIADITREGGFPPLLVDPVDFAALYQARGRGEPSQPD